MLRFAILGTGTMAEIYAAILARRPDCELVAVAGNTEEKTLAFAAAHRVPGYPGSDYGALYARHPDAEVSIVATPEWVRDEPVRAAVEAGQHILLEKPFAVGEAQARRLRDLLAPHPRVVGVGHVLRSSPRFAALKRAVTEGRIGELRQIYARRNSNRDRVMRVLGRTDLAYWLTPHDVDMMRWVTGSEVNRVHAVSRAGLNSRDDYLMAMLHFASGVDAVLEVSWCTPPLSGMAREAVFEVRGTAGSAELEDFEMNVAVYGEGGTVTAPDTYEDYAVHGARRGIFENMIEGFVDRVVRSDVHDGAVRDGYESTRVCAMIRRSVDQGGPVGDA